jgi:hypothetical protein
MRRLAAAMGLTEPALFATDLELAADLLDAPLWREAGIGVAELRAAGWLRIPGTDFKIGLDPVLSLIPGFGSTIASGGGLIILIEAVRSQVSVPVLLRMAANMLLNTLFDYFPAVGPVASAFFKSNSRNLKLLTDWQAGQHDIIKRSTWRLFGVLGLIMLTLGAMLFGLFILYVWLLTRLFHS